MVLGQLHGWLCWNKAWNQPDRGRPSKWPEDAEFVPAHEGLAEDHAFTQVVPLYAAPSPAAADQAPWKPDDRTLRVLASAIHKVAPDLVDEIINRATTALSEEHDHDDKSNGGCTRGLAGEGDASHAGPEGQRDDEQHDDGAAEHGAGLLRSLPHEDRGGGNAARVVEAAGVAPSTPTAAPQDGLVERLTERAAREDYGAGLREDLRRARGLIAELERKLEIVSNWTGEYRQRASLAEDALAAQEARIAELGRERDADAICYGALREQAERAEIAEAALAAAQRHLEAALAAAQRHLEVADQIAERYAVLGGRDTTLLQQYQQLRKG